MNKLYLYEFSILTGREKKSLLDWRESHFTLFNILSNFSFFFSSTWKNQRKPKL